MPRARGVDDSEVEHVDNGWLATFSDPDGNELALWQYHQCRHPAGEQIEDTKEAR
jgi:hypothetical protein